MSQTVIEAKYKGNVVSKKAWCTPKAAVYYKNATSCYSDKDLRKIAKILGIKVLSKPKLTKWRAITSTLDMPETKWVDEIVTNKLKVPRTPQKPSFDHSAVEENRYSPTKTLSEYNTKVQKVEEAKLLRQEVRALNQKAFLPKLGIRTNELIGSDQINAFYDVLKYYSTFRKTIACFYTHNLPKKKFCQKQPESLRMRYIGPNSPLRAFPNNDWNRYIIISNTKVANPRKKTSGHHWVVIYVDRTSKTPGLEYFDSARPGEPSKTRTPELYCLWENFKKWNEEGLLSRAPSSLEANTKPLPVHVNSKEFQKGDRECGMFCMWFVKQRVEGVPMSVIMKKRMNDSMCTSLRSVYFRK